jgi:hypothetical protein
MKVSSTHTDSFFRHGSLRYLLLALFLIGSRIAIAGPEENDRVRIDSVQRGVNEPPENTQEKYYEDDYWTYHLKDSLNPEEENVFDRMWNHFIQSLTKSVTSGSNSGPNLGGSRLWGILFLLILIGLVVFAVLKLTRSGVNSMFKGKNKDKEKIDASLEDVDIHSIDYERMIAEACAVKDYRLAVRLWFLRTLKTLTDEELLNWKIDKTNSDYYYELAGTGLEKDFGEVSFVYDYIWYGEFPVDKKEFEHTEAKFRDFLREIPSHRPARKK